MKAEPTPDCAMLDEVFRSCPYCGEQISLLIDLSGGNQQYIEDCEVCCRPIDVTLQVHGDCAEVYLGHENES